MKIQKILALVLCLFLLVGVFAACGKKDDPKKDDEQTETPAGDNGEEKKDEETKDDEKKDDEKKDDEKKDDEKKDDETPALEGLWKDAKYTEDTELGEGAKTVKVEVKAEDKSVTFTIHTDKDTLAEALVENDLVAGDAGQYGLYITVTNGMTADWDADQAYWALSKDGEYLMTGADSTPIADGEHYEITYTK